MQTKNYWIKAFVDTSPDDYQYPIIDIEFIDDSLQKPIVEIKPFPKKMQFTLVSEKNDPFTFTEIYLFFGEKNAKKFVSELIRVGYVIYHKLVNLRVPSGVNQFVNLSEDWLREIDFDIQELRYQFYELVDDKFSFRDVDCFCRGIMRLVAESYLSYQIKIDKFVAKN